MDVQTLGYVGLRATSLEDWASFGTGLLGLQLAERSGAQLVFRMDDRRQRILVAGDVSDGLGFYGWEVADAAALDAMASRLEAHGIPVTHGDAALADRRRVTALISCADPAGNRMEFFHGAEVADAPFQPGRCISGFRTGPLGMGHVVLTVENLDAVLPFYRDILGFGLSNWLERPFRAQFLHVNPRHHSFAMIETGKAGLHHLMLELFSFDDVGQGYDIAQGERDCVATTLGRHPNDCVTSFYARTPGDLMVEYGWGGRAIDPATWQPFEGQHGPSLWGHDRVWLSPEQREEARLIRLRAAQAGQRSPVQVLAGNFEQAADVCPWWNSAQKLAAE